MFDIKSIANKINDNGGKIYLVGGAVRDELLRIECHDEDYCVTGIEFNDFKNMFPEAIIKGNSFPVFEIEGREFAMARIERKVDIRT